MKKIQMVDLVGQYQKIKKEMDEAVLNVIGSAAFINGPEVNNFQNALAQYLGAKHVIPCANGTDALQVAMMALNLKPGDEVITSSFTFIATAEVIALLGLTPVLVDVLPDTFNIDPEAIRKAITPKTKAIVPVHLFGQCADMEEIMAIANEHQLHVIEDACQAIGAEYTFRDGSVKKAGTIGHVAGVSFFPSKNLGCYGDGGAIFTDDDALAAQLKVIVNHGMTVRYYHDYVGVNSRLDSLQAAVLRVKLNYLDEYTAQRQRAADYYNRAFADNAKITTPVISKNSTHVFHQYTLMLNHTDRDGLQKYLNDKEIPAPIYYPVPLHLQKAYIDPRYNEGDFPVTEKLCKSVISLPMHTELDEEQLNYIATAVLDFVNQE
ncbi:MAG: DegT/DnrJ/EryC1/StrS family aminotransferase [Bacteroidales bacterium]|nr:DegT/DnrJ/EryC1/StrS family aminotransferase [Bacteroidales bacterium]MDD2322466.1 DegT/DnrJ/EryC1/StrS family aminotransferase [Bacteroidales bacterium]MDD3010593.1 DegT/DnrJ/EryC1/StrS family aminotransferase [Bacteroidales bacterium]MDD3961130.1 DegT/DnrJ/EryC1/StrS family aminotransferase [Bacteroidales bacterium]MDY0286088.1 DegT/DnrJ/EryC1/StrS family aminotransferase [Bacteroidales bacterium]